jgi:hypothetical protein
MLIKTLHAFIFLLASHLTFSQITQIRGQVLDEQTSDPLAKASVFINHTTRGVLADDNGEFVLDNLSSASVELVVTYVGYSTFRTTLYPFKMRSERVNIEMTPAVKKLSEVEIKTTKDKQWEKSMKKFKRIFLGDTENASQCMITNGALLSFHEDEQKVFTAQTPEALEIDNYGLGYHIRYFLDSLRADTKSFAIRGNMYFEEMKTDSAALEAQWKKNRMECYKSSPRRLFKALVENRLAEEGFELYVEKNPFRSDQFQRELHHSVEALNLKNVVHNGRLPGQYVIFFKGRIEVHDLNTPNDRLVYKDIAGSVSWITVKGYELEVNKDGIVLNPSVLEVSGNMNKARVADQLAYDYKPGN